MNREALSTSRHFTARAMVVLAIVLVCTLASFDAGAAIAQTSTPKPGPTLIATPIGGPSAVVTTGRLNARTGPGPGYAVAGTVSQGDILLLLGRTTNNAWVKARLPGGTVEGWFSTYYIDADVLISSLPALAVADPWALVTMPRLNVRSGPGVAYSVLLSVPKGRLITLIGRTSNNTYANVVADGVEGWVSTLYIKASAPISRLPVTWVEPTAVPGVISTATPGPALTATPGATPTAGVGATAVPVGPSAVITTGQLNVRPGPGPGYGVVGTVSHWETVDLVGRTGDLAWVKIEVPGTEITGWISSRYIKANVLISSLPVLMQTPPWAVVTTGTLNVRSGPGSEFTVLTTVPQGRMVTLIGRTANNSWVQVVANGVEGWVTTLHIKPSSPVSYLPIAE